jgi:hypothetical protein
MYVCTCGHNLADGLLDGIACIERVYRLTAMSLGLEQHRKTKLDSPHFVLWMLTKSGRALRP